MNSADRATQDLRRMLFRSTAEELGVPYAAGAAVQRRREKDVYVGPRVGARARRRLNARQEFLGKDGGAVDMWS